MLVSPYARGPAGTVTGLTKTGHVIVTISRAYGAGGLAVAEGVSRALDYTLVTHELSDAVAARMGTSPERALQAQAGPSLSERVLSSLDAGTAELVTPSAPRLPGEFDESLRSEIESAVRERAAAGDVVILGRSAGHVLAGLPSLVRIFLSADFDQRVARIAETFGQTPEAARADVERVDTARRNFTKSRYKAVWGDPRFYDLVIDTTRFGLDGATGIVVAAVNAAQALQAR